MKMKRPLLLGSLLALLAVFWGVSMARDRQFRNWIASAPRNEVEAHLATHPDQTDALLRLSFLLRNAGEREAAEKRARRAIEVAPNEERCWTEFSRAASDDKEAIRGLEGFLKVKPESASVRAELARRHLLSGDVAAARTLLEKTLRDSPDSPDGNRVQGDAFAALRQPVDAEKAYRKALSLKDDAETRLALARTLIPLQRYTEIEALCAPVVKAGASPEISQEQRAQALIYAAGGRLYAPLTPQEAAALQERLREADSLSAALRAEERFLAPYFLGESFLRTGNPREAIEPLERSVKLNPMFPGALFSLARAYRLAGDETKADSIAARHIRVSRLLGDLEMYSNRLAQKPGDSEATLRLAGTFEELGNVEQAVSLYRQLAATQGEPAERARKRLKALGR